MFLVEIAQYILYKGVVKMDIQEKINNQFEKVSNELGKTILGDMQEEFIGKRKDIVKHFKSIVYILFSLFWLWFLIAFTIK